MEISVSLVGEKILDHCKLAKNDKYAFTLTLREWKNLVLYSLKDVQPNELNVYAVARIYATADYEALYGIGVKRSCET
jgi:hypothetical protein